MGGPCNFPEFPHAIDESHWLYTSTLDGEVSASNLILTYARWKTEYPWPQQALRGSVVFRDGKMRVALQCPRYDKAGESIDHYAPYELNGTYTLKFQ
jgi:hypothetical protein